MFDDVFVFANIQRRLSCVAYVCVCCGALFWMFVARIRMDMNWFEDANAHL